MSKPKPRSVDIGRFQVDHELSIPARIASLADWAALNYPGLPIPYNVGLRAVEGFKMTPRMDSDQVDRFRETVRRSRPILLKKHGRHLITIRGVGFRASSDDTDALLHAFPATVGRFRTARTRMVETADHIDPKKLDTKNPEVRPFAEWFQQDMRRVLAAVDSEEFQRRLMPPAIEKAKEGK